MGIWVVPASVWRQEDNRSSRVPARDVGVDLAPGHVIGDGYLERSGSIEVGLGLDWMGSSIDGVVLGDDDVLYRTRCSHHWCCKARCIEHR